MTLARRDIVDEEEVGIYHCVSRCVRRAFLCGRDRLTGRSFKHRKKWIRARLSELVSIFAIEVIAYAVMSNHLHSLLRLRPDAARMWTPEEVARRWRLLFPLRRIDGQPAEPTDIEIQIIATNRELVELYRNRLSSLSWFQRCLNENIARRANQEDDCTGHFWEGRFKATRVFDIAAVLATAAYVDLNPIRAGRAKTLEGSDHTSVQDRIHALTGARPARTADWATVPLLAIEEVTGNFLSTAEYLALVEETGRQLVHGKASISPDLAPVLKRLNINPERWVETTQTLGKRFPRVVGTGERIRAAAARANKLWFHGLAAAQRAFLTTQVA